MKKKIWINIPVLAIQAGLVCACAGGIGSTQGRNDTAQSIASHSGLIRRDFDTSQFTLASWQRLNTSGGDINIYIEGDGLAWLDRRTPSLNPTPKNPIALSLAANDPSPNVVYLARPCQYVAFDGNSKPCNDVYWRGKRFSPEVIEAYHRALNMVRDERKNTLGLKTQFNMIGYSGGANIAGILAATRPDVKSLRTVAGNIDNDYFVKFHDVSAMPYSINMANMGLKLSKIPQYHFVGGSDKTIPIDIYKSYEKKLGIGEPICTQYKIIEGNTHTEGWGDVWPSLLSIPVSCQ